MATIPEDEPADIINEKKNQDRRGNLHCPRRYELIKSLINYKLYFIRFSNSLVRSFFNIINTRRIQIDIMKKFKTDKREQNLII